MSTVTLRPTGAGTYADRSALYTTLNDDNNFSYVIYVTSNDENTFAVGTYVYIGGTGYPVQKSESGNWASHSTVYTTNPYTGVAWTPTNIDNLEIGIAGYMDGTFTYKNSYLLADGQVPSGATISQVEVFIMNVYFDQGRSREHWVADVWAVVTYTVPNCKVNIGGVWKSVASMQVNIGGTWKVVTSIKVNIGGTWKTV